MDPFSIRIGIMRGLTKKVVSSLSPFAAIPTRRGACFLHENFIAPTNKIKNYLLLSPDLPLHSSLQLKFIEQYKKDPDWVIITHGIEEENAETSLCCGLYSETPIDDFLTEIPKNSTVYLAFCYQLSDEKWQELSAKHSSLNIIAFGNVAKINTLRTISSLSATLTSREVLEKYSNPLNLIRVFKAGKKLEEIQPLDYLEKPDQLTINGWKIEVDPIFLGDAILKECPEKISDFFEKFSQHFLPADMAKINEILSQAKQDDHQQSIKQFFKNCLYKKTLQKILSTEILKEDPRFWSEVISILSHFGICDKVTDLTPEEVEKIECFPELTTRNPHPKIYVHRVEALCKSKKQLS